MKSGKLNFPEHSGPLQACNGTGLPLPRRGHEYLSAVNVVYGQEEVLATGQ
jgi:hypothetical protein